MTLSPRIFDLPRAELAALAGRALEAAVRASEGRTMVSEVFAAAPGLVDGVHNAEVMAAHGADVIVLNLGDVVLSEPGDAGRSDRAGDHHRTSGRREPRA